MASGNDTTLSFRFPCQIESSLLAPGCITRAWGKQTWLCMILIIGREWCLTEEEITLTDLSLNTTQEEVWIFGHIFIHTTEHRNEFAHRWMPTDTLTYTVSSTFMNNSAERVSTAQFNYGILCFARFLYPSLTLCNFLQPFFPSLSLTPPLLISNPLSRCQVSTAGSH